MWLMAGLLVSAFVFERCARHIERRWSEPDEQYLSHHEQTRRARNATGDQPWQYDVSSRRTGR